MNRKERHKLAMAYIRSAPRPDLIKNFTWLEKRILNRRKTPPWDWPRKWMSLRVFLQLRAAAIKAAQEEEAIRLAAGPW